MLSLELRKVNILRKPHFPPEKIFVYDSLIIFATCPNPADNQYINTPSAE